VARRPITSVSELAALLSQPLGSRSVSGVLRTWPDEGAWYDETVYLRGETYRIEHHDARFAHAIVVRGVDHFWLRSDTESLDYGFGPEGPHHDFQGGPLARHYPASYWEEWISGDPRLVMTSMSSTTCLGREAVRFTMPEVKGGNPMLTADLDTGFVLRSERDDVGVFEEWLTFSTEPLDDALFEDPGPG
jgi:hypothetical protein